MINECIHKYTNIDYPNFDKLRCRTCDMQLDNDTNAEWYIRLQENCNHEHTAYGTDYETYNEIYCTECGKTLHYESDIQHEEKVNETVS